MKKYLYLGFSIMLAFILQSCLKDKGFERQTYGTQSTTSPAVGFAQGSGITDTAIVAGSVSPSTTAFISTDLIQIALEGTPPLPYDVTVNIALAPGLLATDTVLKLFPAGAVTVPTSAVIRAGQQFVFIPITITNPSLLDLTTTYAIGLTITSVSNGLGIVSTRRNVIAQINVQNQFDGVYRLDFTNFHPQANPGYTGSSVEVELRTTGTFTNKIFWPDADAFANPTIFNGGLTYFGSQEPEYTFVPTGPTGGNVTVRNSFTCPTCVVYALNSSFTSTYTTNPVIVINVKWGYFNPGGVFNPASTREWTQKFTYLRPR